MRQSLLPRVQRWRRQTSNKVHSEGLEGPEAAEADPLRGPEEDSKGSVDKRYEDPL